MAGYNRLIMIGNLTRDPEYRQLASGQAVCRMGLATNRQFKNRQTGSMVQEVCFIDVDVWGAQAESCRQYLSKGRPVLIEGRLKFDTWEDQSGQTRSKHSIVADRVVFLGSSAETAESLEEGTQQGNSGFSAQSAPRSAATQSQLDPAIEKELSDQIEQIKQRVSAKPAVKAAPSKKAANKEDGSGADVAAGAFQDEPPFQDDLPF